MECINMSKLTQVLINLQYPIASNHKFFNSKFGWWCVEIAN